jgi:alpha-galactosidase
MLIGTGVLTGPEERTQMSLWAVLAAPLFAGGELSKAAPSTIQVLTNRDVIAVDQDRAGLQGTRVENLPGHQVWVRRLRGGSEAVVLLNTGAKPAVLAASPALLGLQAGRRYAIRDLWGHRAWVAAAPLTALVAPHDVAMYRVGAVS